MKAISRDSSKLNPHHKPEFKAKAEEILEEPSAAIYSSLLPLIKGLPQVEAKTRWPNSFKPAEARKAYIRLQRFNKIK